MKTDIIPTSKLARSRVVAGTILKAGGKHLGHLGKRAFMSSSQVAQDKALLDDATAQLAFDAFCKLRGTALKIAQMLSLETSILPESFRQELSKSYHQVPPLGRVLVRKLLIQEFNKPAEKLFSQFNAKAFAAASLGQVHEAQTNKGEDLAVKMQYPGIDITIDNDLQMLRSLLKRSQHADLLTTSLNEIEQRLREEVNYHIEADNTDWFRTRLPIDGLTIPKVYRKLSSKRVLTTERLRGLHLEEWLLQKPDQAQRDHYAQLIYDTFIESFYGLAALHADPNPGNYLFCTNGKLGLLDFGCVRHFSANFVALMPKLMRAYQDKNAKDILRLYAQVGILNSMPEADIQPFYDKYLQPFGSWITRPFDSESFNFADQHAPFSSEGLKAVSHIAKHATLESMANEFIFFNRTYFGIYNIFERMRATVKMHHKWLQPRPSLPSTGTSAT